MREHVSRHSTSALRSTPIAETTVPAAKQSSSKPISSTSPARIGFSTSSFVTVCSSTPRTPTGPSANSCALCDREADQHRLLYRLLRLIRGYMPWWLPIDTAIRRIPYFGPKFLAALHIPCWNYLKSGPTDQQRLEWAVLDTFDALAARYDLPRTLDEVRAMATLPELKDVEVFYGSNGIVANAMRR